MARRRACHPLRAWKAAAPWLLLTVILGIGAAEFPTLSATGHAAAPYGSPVIDDEIARIIATMSLEEKVAQLFIIHGFGLTVDDDRPAVVAENEALHGLGTWRAILDAYPVGGVVYFNFTDNIQDPAQVTVLSNGLQQVALGQRVPIPLFIAMDQEQGLVRRIGEPHVTELPGNMALAATFRPAYARTAARITAEELRAMGINVNFAPVADVIVNPHNPVIGVRAYGDSPDEVARFTAAQVAGYKEGGVIAAAKHFPGHGNTDVDSHTGLPVIRHTKEQWETTDLPPFEAAIASGVDMMMTAHIVVPSLDASERPATLSAPILTDVLRDEIGFEGIVITDALTMAGARQAVEDERRIALEALHAGADVLLMPPDLETAFHAIVDAVRTGRLAEARIDESVFRILKVKQAAGLFDRPFVNPQDVLNLPQPDRHGIAAELADAGITLVKNAQRRLPLSRNSPGTILLTGWGGGSGHDVLHTLADQLEARGMKVEVLSTGSQPDGTAVHRATTAATEADVVIALTMNAWRSPQQQGLIRALLATGTPVIAVAVGTPYDIAAFPEVPTYLATYGYRPVSLRALARVLTGEVNPRGRLPVTIPPMDRPHTVLYPAGHGIGYPGR